MGSGLELTADARRRVELAKQTMLCVQSAVGRDDEEWHVHMYKRDKKNDDPDCFQIWYASRFFRNRLFNIDVDLVNQRILLHGFRHDLSLYGVTLEKNKELEGYSIDVAV